MLYLENLLPSYWSLIDEYEDNSIYENLNRSFCVNVDYFPGLKYPYSITFAQLKEAHPKIGFENGGYSTYGSNRKEALAKAIEMMQFINLHCYNN